MKSLNIIKLAVLGGCISLYSCNGNNGNDGGKDDPVKETGYGNPEYTYSMSVELMTDTTGPELQSFVHATNGSDWLLFSGRTNYKKTDNGGLHKMTHSDYARTSFPPNSFNTNLYVYNIDDTTTHSCTSEKLLSDMKQIWTSVAGSDEGKKAYLEMLMPKLQRVFRCSNPEVTQDDTYTYVIGGYGPNSASDTSQYSTFNHVARFKTDLLINYVKGTEVPDFSSLDSKWYDLLSFGEGTNLRATGGEVFKIGDTLYLCGGHNFGGGAANGQKYQDAVYPFAVAGSSSDPWALDVQEGSVITDISPVSDVTNPASDNTSKMRRRDGPIVPIVYNESNSLKKGLTFYGGVFMPGPDSDLRAWDFAIYITPEGTTRYAMDSANRQSQNVYSCPDFGLYDSSHDKVYTFMPGGIGDGTSDTMLSPFANGVTLATLDVGTMTSTYENATCFPFLNGDTTFFGAEAGFMLKSGMDANMFTLSDGSSSELLDVSKIFPAGKTSVDIGYVYGGIESKKKSPGAYSTGYGKNISKATGKIWRVTVSRAPLELE